MYKSYITERVWPTIDEFTFAAWLRNSGPDYVRECFNGEEYHRRDDGECFAVVLDGKIHINPTYLK